MLPTKAALSLRPIPARVRSGLPNCWTLIAGTPYDYKQDSAGDWSPNVKYTSGLDLDDLNHFAHG